MLNIPKVWTFKDEAVAGVFEQHVREQLPWYDLATGAVAHIARHYITEYGLVYDIGASTGNIGRALADVLEKRSSRLVAIDDAVEMASRYDGPGKVIAVDATRYDYEAMDVAVLFLVLMFVPVHRRAMLMARLYDAVKPGGAIIVVDKMNQPAGHIGTIMHRLTIAGKKQTGTADADIIAKELSLSGVQRPITEQFFSNYHAHRFFQFGEFVGWLIEKPE